MLTAMAFEYFASVAVDIAVLEVGMGGRLDATNVVDPLISVIADVALDHQKYLGNTIGEIAREKAGIIRANGVVVTLPQHPEANDVIGNAHPGEECARRERDASMYRRFRREPRLIWPGESRRRSDAIAIRSP